MLIFQYEVFVYIFPRARGRNGGRTKKDNKQVEKALKLYDTEQYTVKEIEDITKVSKATLYRAIRERKKDVV